MNTWRFWPPCSPHLPSLALSRAHSHPPFLDRPHRFLPVLAHHLVASFAIIHLNKPSPNSPPPIFLVVILLRPEITIVCLYQIFLHFSYYLIKRYLFESNVSNGLCIKVSLSLAALHLYASSITGSKLKKLKPECNRQSSLETGRVLPTMSFITACLDINLQNMGAVLLEYDLEKES